MTPYQNDIWLKMTARLLGNLSALCLTAAFFAVLGVRFMDHQIKISLIAGFSLFWVSMHLLRYLSPSEPANGSRQRRPDDQDTSALR